MCCKIDEFFVGLDWSNIEDDGIMCRISSSVSNVFADLYTAYYIFYLFILFAIVVDKLYDCIEYFGVIIFF